MPAAVAAGLAMLLAACGAPAPRGSMAELFPQAPQPLDLEYPAGGRRIHYVEMPGAQSARILFVHGSPGRWQDMAGLLGEPELRAKASLLAVDRPGWGASGGDALLPDVEAQARLIEPLLRGPGKAPGEPALLVGYSYGGTVATALALDFPDEVRGLVLVAPALDPALETPRWYYHSTDWWIVRALTPRRFARSNRELLPLAGQLARLQPRLRELKVPTVLIQGDDDDQVDPRTAAYAEREFPRRMIKVVRVPHAGHYVVWRQPRRVVDAALSLLDEATQTEPRNAG